MCYWIAVRLPVSVPAMNRLRIVVLTSLSVGMMSACAAILGIDDPPPVGRPAEDGSTSPERDGASDALDGSELESDACPPGPPDAAEMVRTDVSCIDPYEVTQLDYAAFLGSKKGDVSGQPAECASNTSYVPLGGFPPKPTSVPITWIDWCDATAYCTWAGKRLCGAVDGGALPLDRMATVDDEWFMACSHDNDGLHELPYSNGYDPRACNGPENDAGGAVPVGSMKKCEGGFVGLFDMSGNVREWIASCGVDRDGGRTCGTRGGAYYDNPSSSLYCSRNPTAPADLQNVGIGFRCCASAR